jgi:hypothetical protein
VADDRRIIVHAGASNFMVNLPTSNEAIDLNNGAIAAGRMINVVALPGARMELARAAQATAR